MSTKKEDKRREFKDILFELAKDEVVSEEEQKDYYQRLESLYCSTTDGVRFRHYYSDIFFVISNIKDKKSEGDLATLSENIRTLSDEYCSNENKDIKKELEKLNDHISLDVSRMLYYNILQERMNSETERMLKDVDDKQKEFDRAVATTQERQEEVDRAVATTQERQEEVDRAVATTQDRQEELNDEIKDMQRQYITILGIFATIVLGFTGGIVFSNSVLNNINAVSIYRLIIMSDGIAATIFNIIYLLIWFIRDTSLQRERKLEYPKHMKFVNVICALIAIVTVLAYFIR